MLNICKKAKITYCCNCNTKKTIEINFYLMEKWNSLCWKL